MIAHLQSPSICVIDDEKDDYEPLLNALLKLGLGCVHVKGDSSTNLPPKPFRGLRVVFTDLHLSASTGKDAASHAAKVFSRVVSSETAPVVVVIWSKYKDDVLVGAPPEEDTESELFKKTLLESFPQFTERLVFIDMEKPKLNDRPTTARWVSKLKTQIRERLESLPAFDALWAWESLVRDAAISVTGGLTTLALQPEPDSQQPKMGLAEKLKLGLRLLVREQGGHGCSPESAACHLAAVLGQSLMDHVEHTDARGALARHGGWLGDQEGLPKSVHFSPGINEFLLTSVLANRGPAFVPGYVYRLSRSEKFEQLFGVTPDRLVVDCYSGKENKFEEWKATNLPKPVLIELSPVCDVHQEVRRSALLIGGLMFPADARKCVKRGDAIEILPTFSLRWPVEDFTAKSVFLVFFCRLKTTLHPAKEPRWLVPWFRVRELPTAFLRNWHSSHSSRVGVDADVISRKTAGLKF